MNERKEEEREVLDAAMLAGHILQENGAEIFRVEETMECPGENKSCIDKRALEEKGRKKQ